MKAEKFSVQELSSTELKKTEGGFIISLTAGVIVGVCFGAGAAVGGFCLAKWMLY